LREETLEVLGRKLTVAQTTIASNLPYQRTSGKMTFLTAHNVESKYAILISAMISFKNLKTRFVIKQYRSSYANRKSARWKTVCFSKAQAIAMVRSIRNDVTLRFKNFRQKVLALHGTTLKMKRSHESCLPAAQVLEEIKIVCAIGHSSASIESIICQEYRSKWLRQTIYSNI